ncbi:MAG: permease [Promethearchaeota archaeon]
MNKRTLSGTAGIIFFLFILFLLVLDKIKLFIMPIPQEGMDYARYAWYLVPLVYIVNYFSHAGISLTFAFLLSGLIQEFIPQKTVIKYFGSNRKINYVIAALMAPLFITCSCSVIPIYSALLITGAGIGVAMTFLLMAPAANLLTLWITGDYLGWDLVLLRYVFSFLAAIVCGMIFARTKTAKEIEKSIIRVNNVGEKAKSLEDVDLASRIENWYKNSWEMVKKVLPYLVIGLALVSFLAAYLPEDLIRPYLTGFTGIIIGAAIGGPLYTPTLVEIVLTKSLLNSGMSRSTALSFMMGQPYDVVSMAPNSKFFKWKGVAIYTIIFFLFSILSGILYGLVLGELA